MALTNVQGSKKQPVELIRSLWHLQTFKTFTSIPWNLQVVQGTLKHYLKTQLAINNICYLKETLQSIYQLLHQSAAHEIPPLRDFDLFLQNDS